MTEEQLQEIEARANAATPGPWTIDRYENSPPDEFRGIDAGDILHGICTTDCNVYGPGLPDAEFICHARQDVPALVAEVRRLRLEINGLRGRLDEGNRRVRLGVPP